MTDFRNLRTVRQLAKESDAFSEGSLRWLTHNREKNGFAHCVVRAGGRVLIDLPAFNSWLEARRAEHVA